MSTPVLDPRNPFPNGPRSNVAHMRPDILVGNRRARKHEVARRIKALRRELATSTAVPVSNPLATMTVTELRATARDRGIRGFSKMTKFDLIKALS